MARSLGGSSCVWLGFHFVHVGRFFVHSMPMGVMLSVLEGEVLFHVGNMVIKPCVPPFSLAFTCEVGTKHLVGRENCACEAKCHEVQNWRVFLLRHGMNVHERVSTVITQWPRVRHRIWAHTLGLGLFVGEEFLTCIGAWVVVRCTQTIEKQRHPLSLKTSIEWQDFGPR